MAPTGGVTRGPALDIWFELQKGQRQRDHKAQSRDRNGNPQTVHEPSTQQWIAEDIKNVICRKSALLRFKSARKGQNQGKNQEDSEKCQDGTHGHELSVESRNHA